MEQLVQSVFSYEDEGENCLFAVLHMMRFYYKETKQLADSSIVMFNEIESLFIYLIQLAERNNIDMDRIINVTNDAGQSIFNSASEFSEKISLELLKWNVKVNGICNNFTTPVMKVR